MLFIHMLHIYNVCMSVKRAFVIPTNSTVQLRNSLCNTERNTLHIHVHFSKWIMSNGGGSSVATRGCSRVSHVCWTGWPLCLSSIFCRQPHIQESDALVSCKLSFWYYYCPFWVYALTWWQCSSRMSQNSKCNSTKQGVSCYVTVTNVLTDLSPDVYWCACNNNVRNTQRMTCLWVLRISPSAWSTSAVWLSATDRILVPWSTSAVWLSATDRILVPPRLLA
jgi:hypothetical protein